MTTEQIDELYEIIQPLLDAGDPAYARKIRQNWQEEASGILSWAVKSGYFLWARHQPKPLDPTKAWAWIRENRDKLETMHLENTTQLQENETKMKEVEAKITAEERKLAWAKREADKIKSSLNTKGLLIERAIRRERHEGDPRMISKENMMEDGTIITQSKPFHRQVASTLCSVQDKYRWTSSAMAMVTYLLETRFDAIGWPPDLTSVRSFTQGLTLPYRHVWIELEKPVGDYQGIFLIYSTHDHTLNPFYHTLDEIKRFDGISETIDTSTVEVWTLVLFDATGDQIWNLHIAQFPDDEGIVWGPSDFHLCLTGECHVEEGKFVACEICVKTACSWLSWIGLAHLMITGAFQEQEETKINEIVERAIRKVPRPDKPQKFMEIPVEHHYRIVRFDACMREVKRPHDTQEHHGSWVEATKAIDPDAIVYVQRHIAKTERTLRHERYTHKRGQTINVNAHDKRIPMKVSELNKKITRIIASKFEQHSA